MPIDVVSGVFMGGVALLACVDLAASVARAGPAPRARPSPERRCPYCHQGLERDVARARCAGCGTAHHAICWEDHGGCSVFGCGSLLRAGASVPGKDAPAAAEIEVLPEVDAADVILVPSTTPTLPPEQTLDVPSATPATGAAALTASVPAG